jgi:hypothetical protein
MFILIFIFIFIFILIFILLTTKNKYHLNPDGLGLEKILQLKNKMTHYYKSKTINNHRKD